MNTRPLAARFLALALAAASPFAAAQEYAFGFDSRGDAWFEVYYHDVNRWAEVDLYGYVEEVCVVTGAPRYYVEELVVERHWAPADVWMAAELSRVSGRSLSTVVDTYTSLRSGTASATALGSASGTVTGGGWGATAQRLGIKPGSAEFHALKSRMGKQRDVWKAKGKPARGRSTTTTTATTTSPGNSGKARSTPRGASSGRGQGQGQGKAKGPGKPKGGKGKGKDKG